MEEFGLTLSFIFCGILCMYLEYKQPILEKYTEDNIYYLHKKGEYITNEVNTDTLKFDNYWQTVNYFKNIK